MISYLGNVSANSSNRIVSVVKSSGIGLTLEHDQKLACKAIRKELNKVFKGSVR